jgi:hypothetical protein
MSLMQAEDHENLARLCNRLYGPLPIARDAPIVHFRSQAVSGMMSL